MDPANWTDIERKMNVTTQQYLIGRENANQAMIELHERELLILWAAILVLFGLMALDHMILRKEISSAKLESE